MVFPEHLMCWVLFPLLLLTKEGGCREAEVPGGAWGCGCEVPVFRSLPHDPALQLCPQESLQTDLIEGDDWGGSNNHLQTLRSPHWVGWRGRSLSLSPASGSSVFTRRPSQASQVRAAPAEAAAVPARNAAVVILALPLGAWGIIGVERFCLFSHHH